MEQTILGKVLELWVELTGVDPEQERFTIGDWELRDIAEEIQEAIDLDATETTAFLLLDYFAHSYFEQKSFTINQIIDTPENATDYVGKAINLYKLLRSGPIEEIRKAFLETTAQMISHYNVTNPDTIKISQDLHWLAVLRRDALKSMEDLKLHQFLHGKVGDGSPKYINNVYMFWNINSLIKGLCNMPEGISLSLVMHPKNLQSYFVFGIRNGGTVSILTDKREVAHAMQEEMSRKPGKAFMERAYQNRFPYQLIEYATNSKGEAYIPESSALVTYQQHSHKMKAINNLYPDQMIWVAMMFSLIHEKFWKQDHKQELSYTGEMLKVENALIDSPEAKALITTEYKPISAPALTIDDMDSDKMIADDNWGWHDTPKDNEWLFQRYKDQIHSDDLNLMLPENENRILIEGESEAKTMTDKQINKYKENNWGRSAPSVYKLKPIDPTFFGSKEEVIKEQKWHGRYNAAMQIDKLAEEEYTANKDEVEKWYHDHVRANVDFLYECIARGECMAPVDGTHMVEDRLDKPEDDWLRCFHVFKTRYTPDRNILARAVIRYIGYEFAGFRGVCIPEDFYTKECCPITGGKASLIFRFRPTTPQAYAIMCGCKVEELPIFLQHTYKESMSHGNSILDRIDPMEWVVSNPWRRLALHVKVYMSKRGFLSLLKKHELPVDKWYIEWVKKELEERAR